MDKQPPNTDTKNADKPELHGLACSTNPIMDFFRSDMPFQVANKRRNQPIPEIPEEIIEAALKIKEWAIRENFTCYQLHGICDYAFANRMYRDGYDQGMKDEMANHFS